MNALRELIARGGPVMIALMIISVLLYERCFNLLLFLYRARRQVVREFSNGGDVIRVRALQQDLQDAFRQQRLAIDAMITSAPLLGLLGTVMGMIAAFNNLSSHGGQRSMEGLARGISEVLVATESGLAVAIPAVLLVYYAHRQLQKGLQRLVGLESTLSATP
jgi:biopolymer transport protein ExbB